MQLETRAVVPARVLPVAIASSPSEGKRTGEASRVTLILRIVLIQRSNDRVAIAYERVHLVARRVSRELPQPRERDADGDCHHQAKDEPLDGAGFHAFDGSGTSRVSADIGRVCRAEETHEADAVIPARRVWSACFHQSRIHPRQRGRLSLAGRSTRGAPRRTSHSLPPSARTRPHPTLPLPPALALGARDGD